MKHLTILLAAVLLAVAPAAADAKSTGSKHAHHARTTTSKGAKHAAKAHGRKATARSAASQCISERSRVGVTRFRAKYGTAAMNRCVSTVVHSSGSGDTSSADDPTADEVDDPSLDDSSPDDPSLDDPSLDDTTVDDSTDDGS
jgi:hypothetical protein